MLASSDDLPEWWSTYDTVGDLDVPDAAWERAVSAAFDDSRDVDYALYDAPTLETDAADDDLPSEDSVVTAVIDEDTDAYASPLPIDHGWVTPEPDDTDPGDDVTHDTTHDSDDAE